MLKKILIFAALFQFSHSVQAAEAFKRHEILVNSSEYGLNAVAFGGGSTIIAFGGGYNYRLIDLLQLGARIGVTHKDIAAVSATTFYFLAGATLNFPTDWKFENRFFGGMHIGLIHASIGAGSTTPFIFDFEMGKRFEIFPNLTYRPTFELIVPTNGASVVAGFKLLALSLVF